MAHTDSSHHAGYETRDVAARGVILLGVALVMVTGLAMLLLGWLFNQLSAAAKRDDPPVSPLAAQAGRAPGPDLELKLRHREFDAADLARLQNYAWIDRKQQVVHIPVERAMQLLVDRGLPEPSRPMPPATNGDDATPQEGRP